MVVSIGKEMASICSRTPNCSMRGMTLKERMMAPPRVCWISELRSRTRYSIPAFSRRIAMVRPVRPAPAMMTLGDFTVGESGILIIDV